jgi:hypothetical protein
VFIHYNAGVPSRIRSKLVSFRLTPEEFSSLQELARMTGQDSVSELARFAITQLAQNGKKGSAPQLYEHLDTLEKQLRRLRFDVDTLIGQQQ